MCVRGGVISSSSDPGRLPKIKKVVLGSDDVIKTKVIITSV